MMSRVRVTTALSLAGLLASGTVLARPERTERYAVTVTNLTYGQVFSPPVVVSHGPGLELFIPGAPASPELAAVAEDADSAGLVDLLWSDPATQDVVVADGMIHPGESMTILIETRRPTHLISLVSMLVTTNDAFVGLRDVKAGRDVHLYALAYDAGSEINNEDCDFIPGPPCGMPFMHPAEAPEGFIHVHRGVHGGADLEPAVHDWRNPVASVTIEKVR